MSERPVFRFGYGLADASATRPTYRRLSRVGFQWKLQLRNGSSFVAPNRTKPSSGRYKHPLTSFRKTHRNSGFEGSGCINAARGLLSFSSSWLLFCCLLKDSSMVKLMTCAENLLLLLNRFLWRINYICILCLEGALFPLVSLFDFVLAKAVSRTKNLRLTKIAIVPGKGSLYVISYSAGRSCVCLPGRTVGRRVRQVDWRHFPTVL